MKLQEKEISAYEAECRSTIERLMREMPPFKEAEQLLELVRTHFSLTVRRSQRPKVIVLGSDFPEELIYAFGITPYWVLGGSLQTGAWAGELAPRDADPVSRSMLGFLLGLKETARDALILLPIVNDSTMPVIVRDLDRDTAIIYMVDSNIQRENISPMEKAKALKMKLEAIKRQGQRTDLTCAQVEHKLDGKKSVEVVAEAAGESRAQVQRYIRLNELSPELQQMVDDKKIAMTPAVELSYLKQAEQALLVETMESEQATPSLSQAQRMKKMSQSGELNEDTMLSVMSEQKKPEVDRIVLTTDTLRMRTGLRSSLCNLHTCIGIWSVSKAAIYFDEIADGIYDYSLQDGFNHLGEWVESAARRKGK